MSEISRDLGSLAREVSGLKATVEASLARTSSAEVRVVALEGTVDNLRDRIGVLEGEVRAEVRRLWWAVGLALASGGVAGASISAALGGG